MPWDHTGAAIIALGAGLLLFLNASVPVFTTMLGLGSLIALLAHKQIDSIGAALLESSFGGLFARLSEAPLLAWAGWESNRLTGGVICGLALGGLSGALLVKLVTSVRARLAELEEGSPAFKDWTSKPWVRFLAWLLLG